MILFSNELHYAANKKQVTQLSDIWQRYIDLAKETSTDIPPSFLSRRTIFNEKIQYRVGDVFQFIQPLQCNKLERETLLVPYKYSHDLIAAQFYHNADDDEMLTIPSYQQQEDTFKSLLHVALKRKVTW